MSFGGLVAGWSIFDLTLAIELSPSYYDFVVGSALTLDTVDHLFHTYSNVSNQMFHEKKGCDVESHQSLKV